MMAIQDIFQNPLTRQLQDNAKHQLKEKFPELRDCPHQSYLSLSKYLKQSPERFYSHTSFEVYSSFLTDENNNQSARLQNILNQEIYRLDKAFLLLSEINRENWHDSFTKFDDYEFMRFCDKTLHPSYLKLIEGVFFPFVYLLAATSRLDKGKSLEGLKVFNCVEELKQTNYSVLCNLYDNVVRNSIAHGGTMYRDKEIVYRDKKGNEHTFTHGAVVSIVDDLLDLCDACALSLKLFYLLHLNSNLNIPRQLMIEELQEETDLPWWHIEGCLLSELAGKSQLIIYARPTTRDYYKVQYSTFLSGVLSEQFVPDFDRYFVSLRSAHAWPGWAAFDGKKLKQIREHGSRSFEDYKGVVQDNLIFYVLNFKLPRFLGRLDTLWQSFRIHLPLVFAQIHSQLNHVSFTVRNADIHRNGWRSVLHGSVILHLAPGNNGQEAVRQSCRKIIRKVLRTARQQAKLTNVAKFLPLGYARIAVFNKDFRIRKLENYGLRPELIGTLQIQRIRRIKAPDIFGSTIETKGPFRIAWNKSWLESLTIENTI
ncbi:hypothetical protein KJ693_11370 [bacterium]|nr:hypothetical protein [bacterium]MBU1615889.1 hypothetical protein [bacterium]